MKNKYCSGCGRKLIKVIKSAEKVKNEGYADWHYSSFSKFNDKTGKRQFASYWKCPINNHIWNCWGTWHDSFEEEASLTPIKVGERK